MALVYGNVLVDFSDEVVSWCANVLRWLQWDYSKLQALDNGICGIYLVYCHEQCLFTAIFIRCTMSATGAATLYYMQYVCTCVSIKHPQSQKLRVTQHIGGIISVMLYEVMSVSCQLLGM